MYSTNLAPRERLEAKNTKTSSHVNNRHLGTDEWVMNSSGFCVKLQSTVRTDTAEIRPRILENRHGLLEKSQHEHRLGNRFTMKLRAFRARFRVFCASHQAGERGVTNSTWRQYKSALSFERGHRALALSHHYTNWWLRLLDVTGGKCTRDCTQVWQRWQGCHSSRNILTKMNQFLHDNTLT